MTLAVFGWVCAFVGAVTSLPQILRIVRAGTAEGVSLRNWQMIFGANLAWIIHGLVQHQPNIWATNALVGLGAGTIIWLVAGHSGRSRLLAMVGLPLVVMVVCAGVDAAMGALAFGIVIGLPQDVGAVFQLRDLVTAPHVTGLSLAFMLVNLLSQGLWTTWAVGAHDPAVMFAGGSMFVLQLVNLAWYLMRRAGLPARGRPRQA